MKVKVERSYKFRLGHCDRAPMRHGTKKQYNRNRRKQEDRRERDD
jgi:hypothetical protein